MLAASGTASAIPTAPNDHQIAICHATGSATNPYVITYPSKKQIYTDNGHATGKAVHVNDIIPPFAAGSLGNGSNSWGDFGGYNWDAEGQAIWTNDCKVPKPTPTPTETTKPPTPTPTETTKPPTPTPTQTTKPPTPTETTKTPTPPPTTPPTTAPPTTPPVVTPTTAVPTTVAPPPVIVPTQAVPTAVAAGIGDGGSAGGGSSDGLLAKSLVGAGLMSLLAAAGLQRGRKTRGAHQA
ncbi:MAG: hypothetical protein ACRDPJ_01880 [Nocardioidaceae bacterium]